VDALVARIFEVRGVPVLKNVLELGLSQDGKNIDVPVSIGGQALQQGFEV